MSVAHRARDWRVGLILELLRVERRRASPPFTKKVSVLWVLLAIPFEPLVRQQGLLIQIRRAKRSVIAPPVFEPKRLPGFS